MSWNRKRGGLITLLVFFCVAAGFSSGASGEKDQRPLRCIIFYTNVKGVNSVVA